MGDQDDIEQAAFNRFIATKVGTHKWVITERNRKPCNGFVGIPRQQFDQWKQEYEATQ